MNYSLDFLVRERISGICKEYNGDSFLKVILEDTIPVPFFGDYNQATVATLSLNPSSEEFYSNYGRGNSAPLKGDSKRFVHLSEDLGLDSNFYRMGGRLDDQSAKDKIHKSLIEYFSGPKSNWNGDWFRFSEIAINRGLDASYFDQNFKRKAFHLDLSPWVTRQWRQLGETQNDLLRENSPFLVKFLSQSNLEHLVVLGQSTLDSLEKVEGVDINFLSDNKSVRGSYEPTFQSGSFACNAKRINLYYSSFSPSAGKSTALYSRKTTSDRKGMSSKDNLAFFNEKFGAFIARCELASGVFKEGSAD